MKKIKILHKTFSKPISCLTAYSPSIANILDGKIDLILVGDSIGSTLYGMKNTQGVTMDMMKNHGAVVNKAIKKSLKVLDMPYKTYDNKIDAYKNAKVLLNHCRPDLLKIEVSEKKLVVLKYLVDKKVNVISHIGVTPQSYKNFNKIKVLGKTNKEKQNLLELAKESEILGAKAVLLECVTTDTAKLITENISIPTIGIGASKYCDGQVLVFDDLINLTTDDKKPKFVKNYFNFNKVASNVVKKYNREVKLKKFPSTKFSYN
ncbi:3-methyl-2-oxobutanoate hydroxymethyltransferase [bacterium]|nr:3-methyl-2-oxobutanoate hydroxymethyltransferase [bacterium]